MKKKVYYNDNVKIEESNSKVRTGYIKNGKKRLKFTDETTFENDLLVRVAFEQWFKKQCVEDQYVVLMLQDGFKPEVIAEKLKIGLTAFYEIKARLHKSLSEYLK